MGEAAVDQLRRMVGGHGPVGGDEDLLWLLVGQDWVLVVIGDEKKQVEVMLGVGMMVSQTGRV